MTKSNKALIVALAASFVIWVSVDISSYLSLDYLSNSLRSQFVSNELLGKSVPPNGRWKIEIYVSDAGAMASSNYYAKVIDQKRDATREIGLDGSKFVKEQIRWRSDDVVSVFGYVINVRSGTSFVEKSISPDGKWRIKVYDISPRGQGFVSRYAEFVDLKTDQPTRKIVLEQDKILGDNISWKSANLRDWPRVAVAW